jgi:hypothetical protein
MTVPTTLTAPVPAHLVVVASDGFEYLAECSCGWAGDWQAEPAAADLDGAEHRGHVIPASDPTDALLTRLLDLQDDLGAVVIWLAENWSTGLPVITHYGNGSDNGTQVVLLAYCDTLDELEAVAGLMGVTPVDDPAPNRQGHRYRRATLVFGQVRLLAYITLDRSLAVGES